MRRHTESDQFFAVLGRGLATVAGVRQTDQPAPVHPSSPADSGLSMSDSDRAESIRLMRVNHVGEVCAQALYEGQALATDDVAARALFRGAAREEGAHLDWTAARLSELGGRPSLLNPLWYGGSLALGLAASRTGSAHSLGFMAETERQVEAHLQRHLECLPASDVRSRAVLEVMKADEAAHAQSALQAGARELPGFVKAAMRMVARVMTTTARYI